MNKFFKKFFKSFVIFFGIIFLLAILALGTVLFIGISKPASKFGLDIDQNIAAALGIDVTASLTSYIMAICANIFASGSGVSALLIKLNSLSEMISIGLISGATTILGLWAIFTIVYYATTKKIAGIRFDSNRNKQLSQLEDVQEEVDLKVQWLKKHLR